MSAIRSRWEPKRTFAELLIHWSRPLRANLPQSTSGRLEKPLGDSRKPKATGFRAGYAERHRHLPNRIAFAEQFGRPLEDRRLEVLRKPADALPTVFTFERLKPGLKGQRASPGQAASFS